MPLDPISNLPFNQYHLDEFWNLLDSLVMEGQITFEKPSRSLHEQNPDLIFPIDFGYLTNIARDKESRLGVWIGSDNSQSVGAVALTIDRPKLNFRTELLIGCTPHEKESVLNFLNNGSTSAVYLTRGGELSWLKTRRSMRDFIAKEVPDDLLHRVLETAIWAPSAHNRQPWRFAVLHSREAKEKLAKAMGADFSRDLQEDGLSKEDVETCLRRSRDRIVNAPIAVLLCLDPSEAETYPDLSRQRAENQMAIQSVALAGGYLLLAAHAVGLAGVWLCAPLFTQDTVCRALEIPSDWLPQALILLGFPASQPRPQHRRPLDEISIYL